MKRIIIGLIGICILLGLLLWTRHLPENSKVTIKAQPVPPVTLTPMIEPLEKSVKIRDETYAYATITTPSNALTLIPNYETKTDFTTLISTNRCIAATSGGFYDTSNKPLGLVIISGKIIQQSLTSPLFNGFFWIDRQHIAHITETNPDADAQIALQTGPILRLSDKATVLQIHDDKHARRMVAAVHNASVYFFTIYSKESVFDGPLLADVPALLEQIASLELLQLTDAINLDGGSASAFYGNNLKLSELTPIGSLFCIKP